MLKQPIQCEGCPLYGKGTGFVLGSGDPKKAKVGVMLEAPGREELTYAVNGPELERRRLAFPHLDEFFLKQGMPVVGKAGAILWTWALGPLSLGRDTCFVDNVLRCLPPRVGDSQYPTGDERKKAEAHCRQYDRWGEYGPTLALVNIHPAAIARETTPLVLMNRAFEKAVEARESGERPLVLCGGKASKAWLGYAENVTKWCGHYQRETARTSELRELRRLKGLEVVVKEKGKKVKKLTVKSALALILGKGVAWDTNGAQGVDFNFTLTKTEFDEMSALLVSKGKTK